MYHNIVKCRIKCKTMSNQYSNKKHVVGRYDCPGVDKVSNYSGRCSSTKLSHGRNKKNCSSRWDRQREVWGGKEGESEMAVGGREKKKIVKSGISPLCSVKILEPMSRESLGLRGCLRVCRMAEPAGITRSLVCWAPMVAANWHLPRRMSQRRQLSANLARAPDACEGRVLIATPPFSMRRTALFTSLRVKRISSPYLTASTNCSLLYSNEPKLAIWRRLFRSSQTLQTAPPSNNRFSRLDASLLDLTETWKFRLLAFLIPHFCCFCFFIFVFLLLFWTRKLTNK